MDSLLEIAKWQGGRARLANVPRNNNPYYDNNIKECRAWFEGWDKVNRAEEQIKEYERK